MKIKPVLGDWEIPRIESIRTLENRSFVELAVPGKVGSLFQDLNARPTRIAIAGSLYSDEVRDEFLEELRGKFRAGEPVTFVADIVTATEVQYVIIETLDFQESGRKPEQLDYSIVLQESPPPPPPAAFGGIDGLDASLLDQAGNLLDSATGLLDALESLGNIPNFADPTPPIRGALDGVKATTSGIDAIANDLQELFGP